MKPTDEQLRDPGWWGQNSLPNHTHYCANSECFFDIKRVHHANFTNPVDAIPRPTAWKGEGLPPVGYTEKDCELNGVVGFREGFEVVAHKGVAAIVWGPLKGDAEGQVETLLACHFKPLRTKEEVEREEVVELALLHDLRPRDGMLASRRKFYEDLYDAGMLRKPMSRDDAYDSLCRAINRFHHGLSDAKIDLILDSLGL